MALRSLDNALPASEERPRKIAKVATAKTEVTAAPIGENSAPPLNAAEASMEYIASCDLLPLDDPEKKAKNLLEDLDSKDWLKLCEALNNVRRLALHHSALIMPIIEKVMTMTAKSMKNPRSAVCKSAVMASTDLFSSVGPTLALTSPATKDSAFDQLLLQLLLKASQDKKFVCEEADKSLREMATFLSPLPLMKKLQLYVKHANLKVRAKAAGAMAHCVGKMEFEILKEFGLVGLLNIAADLLNDRLPEARESARAMVNAVHHVVVNDQESAEPEEASRVWQDFCLSNLRPSSAQSIAKITLQY